MNKTYKREIAALLLVFCGYLAVADKTEALEMYIVPTFTFAALAFGMDWSSKQTGLTRGRSNGSSEEVS